MLQIHGTKSRRAQFLKPHSRLNDSILLKIAVLETQTDRIALFRKSVSPVSPVPLVSSAVHPDIMPKLRTDIPSNWVAAPKAWTPSLYKATTWLIPLPSPISQAVHQTDQRGPPWGVLLHHLLRAPSTRQSLLPKFPATNQFRTSARNSPFKPKHSGSKSHHKSRCSPGGEEELLGMEVALVKETVALRFRPSYRTVPPPRNFPT